jgi:hypothetical protein
MAIKTVGELRSALSGFADDTELFAQHIDLFPDRVPVMKINRVYSSAAQDDEAKFYYNAQDRQEAEDEGEDIKITRLEKSVCVIDLDRLDDPE